MMSCQGCDHYRIKSAKIRDIPPQMIIKSGHHVSKQGRDKHNRTRHTRLHKFDSIGENRIHNLARDRRWCAAQTMIAQSMQKDVGRHKSGTRGHTGVIFTWLDRASKMLPPWCTSTVCTQTYTAPPCQSMVRVCTDNHTVNTRDLPALDNSIYCCHTGTILVPAYSQHARIRYPSVSSSPHCIQHVHGPRMSTYLAAVNQHQICTHISCHNSRTRHPNWTRIPPLCRSHHYLSPHVRIIPNSWLQVWVCPPFIQISPPSTNAHGPRKSPTNQIWRCFFLLPSVATDQSDKLVFLFHPPNQNQRVHNGQTRQKCGKMRQKAIKPRVHHINKCGFHCPSAPPDPAHIPDPLKRHVDESSCVKSTCKCTNCILDRKIRPRRCPIDPKKQGPTIPDPLYRCCNFQLKRTPASGSTTNRRCKKYP